MTYRNVIDSRGTLQSLDNTLCYHSGKSAIIRESNHVSGVCEEHYAQYYVPKSSILLAGTGILKLSSVLY